MYHGSEVIPSLRKLETVKSCKFTIFSPSKDNNYNTSEKYKREREREREREGEREGGREREREGGREREDIN